MTEAEILQLTFDVNEAMSSLFSIFFGIISAYIAGLYFFLYKSPLTLKAMAFLLLTFGFLFLGQSMSGVEARLLGIIEAWNSVAVKTTGIEDFKQSTIPLPIRDVLNWLGLKPFSYDGERVVIYTGWITSIFVYFTLFYATFIYKWPER